MFIEHLLRALLCEERDIILITATNPFAATPIALLQKFTPWAEDKTEGWRNETTLIAPDNRPALPLATRRLTHRKTLTVKLAAANKRIPKPSMKFRFRRGTWTSRIWTLPGRRGSDQGAPTKLRNQLGWVPWATATLATL